MAIPMDELLDRIRTRLIPALLTAAGVTMVTAGLLSYTNPVDAGRPSTLPEPSVAVASAAPSPSRAPSPSGSGAASPSPSLSAEPSESPPPSTVPDDRVATRVTVPALRIDLPVIDPPGGANTYPVCNVAMYTRELSQPGLGGQTYLYAHARKGMFLPLLEESLENRGRRMIGMVVEVYTSDDQVFLYEITKVRPKVPKPTAYDDVFNATTEQLWLQTSEGPRGTPTVLQVVAKPLGSGPADHATANPKPKPVVCG
jgi:sortase (surface protein transpeptidase)